MTRGNGRMTVRLPLRRKIEIVQLGSSDFVVAVRTSAAAKRQYLSKSFPSYRAALAAARYELEGTIPSNVPKVHTVCHGKVL